MNSYTFKILSLSFALTIHSPAGLQELTAAGPEALWELVNGQENADQEWKIKQGGIVRVEGGAGLRIDPEGTYGVHLYRYVRYDFTNAEHPQRYLQIKARAANATSTGTVTNISREGGMVGLWGQGITTFDLLNTPSLRSRSSGKGTWALSLFSNAPFILESVSCTAEITDGILFEPDRTDGDLALQSGDTLRVKAFTSDPDAKDQTELPAEIVWRDHQIKNALRLWSGKRGADLMLQRVSEGHFEAELIIDDEMATLMSIANGPAMVGVRILPTRTPLLGWIAFTIEGEGLTESK